MQKLLKATAAVLCAVGIGLTSGGFTSVASAEETLPQAPAPTIISKNGDIGSVTVVADESQTSKYGPLEYCKGDYCRDDKSDSWRPENRFNVGRYSHESETVTVSVRYTGNEKYSVGKKTTVEVKTAPLPEFPQLAAKWQQPLSELKIPFPWKLTERNSPTYVGQGISLERDWSAPQPTDQTFTWTDKNVNTPKPGKYGFDPRYVDFPVINGKGTQVEIFVRPTLQEPVKAKILNDDRIRNWKWTPDAQPPTADTQGLSYFDHWWCKDNTGYFDDRLLPTEGDFPASHDFIGSYLGGDCFNWWTQYTPDAPGSYTLVTLAYIRGLANDSSQATTAWKIYKTPFTIPDSKSSTAANTSATKPSESTSQPSKDNNGGSGGGIFAFLGIALIPLIFVILKAVGIPLPF